MIKKAWFKLCTIVVIALVLITGTVTPRTAKADGATLDAVLACPDITIDYSIDNPDEFDIEVGITLTGPSGLMASYSSTNAGDSFTSSAASWAYIPTNGSVIDIALTYSFIFPAKPNVALPQVTIKITYNCAGGTGGGVGCLVLEGLSQDLLTAPHLLYWAPDLSKGTEKYTIPAGAVVSVLDNKTPGWLRINWACGIYYIRAVDHVPNVAKITKPFSNGK